MVQGCGSGLIDNGQWVESRDLEGLLWPGILETGERLGRGEKPHNICG